MALDLGDLDKGQFCTKNHASGDGIWSLFGNYNFVTSRKYMAFDLPTVPTRKNSLYFHEKFMPIMRGLGIFRKLRFSMNRKYNL